MLFKHSFTWYVCNYPVLELKVSNFSEDIQIFNEEWVQRVGVGVPVNSRSLLNLEKHKYVSSNFETLERRILDFNIACCFNLEGVNAS